MYYATSVATFPVTVTSIPADLGSRPHNPESGSPIGICDFDDTSSACPASKASLEWTGDEKDVAGQYGNEHKLTPAQVWPLFFVFPSFAFEAH